MVRKHGLPGRAFTQPRKMDFVKVSGHGLRSTLLLDPTSIDRVLATNDTYHRTDQH